MRRAAAFLPVLLSLLSGLSRAQDAQAPPDPGYTLHVYANRMQVPTLILNGNDENLRNVAADKIDITLDGGPRFHPTGLRLEGNDPLHLAVLLDVAGTDQDLLSSVIGRLPKFAASSLQPSDHISLYAVGCTLVGSLNQASATTRNVTLGLDSLLHYPTLRGPDKHHCATRVQLWDAIGTILDRMRGTPGRRVLLVVSEGFDTGSTIGFNQVNLLAGMGSITIFNLRSNPATVGDLRLHGMPFSGAPDQPRNAQMYELTSTNGGMIFTGKWSDVPLTLEHIVRLLRTRYILEFPAPDEAEGGLHGISVHVPKANLVLPTGATWTSASPALKDDPSTVQGSASPAVLGKQRPTLPK